MSCLLKRKFSLYIEGDTYVFMYTYKTVLKDLSTVITLRQLERSKGTFVFYFIFCGCFYNKQV